VNIAASVLELIGNTPMVRLNSVTKDIGAEVVVKLEYLNPSGSIKDRIALRMIEDAERAGLLKPGMEIVEASTGNTATALAFVGAVKGYRVHLYVPNMAASEERVRILKAYGAELTVVDLPQQDGQSGGLHGSIVELAPRQRCLEAERENKAVWWARQFSNPSNSLAHTDTTAKEILEQTDGEIDAFVTAVGTCGTLVGVAKALKAHNPAIQIVAVEPRSSPAVDEAGNMIIPVIEGVTGGLLLEMVEKKIADRVMRIDQSDAIAMAHRMAQEEGIFCGLSSGANVVAATQIARELGPGKRVVTMCVDSRDRYLFKEQLTT
jgi:cysteine synthase A